MSLTAKDVAEIMRLLEQSTFDCLSLEMDGVKLNLQRKSAAPAEPAIEAQPTASIPSSTQSTMKAGSLSEFGLTDVPSPLLGIFHRAPKPGEPSFVEVGSRVEEETIIGIIEVMKLMNSVRAGVKGEVVEILVENGAAVEYGQVLLRVRPQS
jgi:acetyl-CoA carboxylase biotin carboxyl carrier protein